MKLVRGDLINMALAGDIDVIVHGCNCLCQMGRGFALGVRNHFPEAIAADKATTPRDRSKLGSYSVGRHRTDDDFVITIVNAYTQFNRRDDDPNKVLVEYDAVRSVMQKVAKQFGHLRIGLPLIGTKLANGDWSLIEQIILEELDGCDVTIVHYAFDYAGAFAAFHDQTLFLSDSNAALKTPAGQALLGVGTDVVREIFALDIELNAHTMALLATIVGQTQVHHEHAGKIELMAADWRKWARENGHL